MQRDDIIEGWKDIAEALGVSVRTAQRYKRKHGLRVTRDVTGAYLHRDDLSRWLAAARSRAA